MKKALGFDPAKDIGKGLAIMNDMDKLAEKSMEAGKELMKKMDPSDDQRERGKKAYQERLATASGGGGIWQDYKIPIIVGIVVIMFCCCACVVIGYLAMKGAKEHGKDGGEGGEFGGDEPEGEEVE